MLFTSLPTLPATRRFQTTGTSATRLMSTASHTVSPSHICPASLPNTNALAVISDIGYFGQTQPEIFQIGCNQGTVNSFSVISPAQLSNGAYTAQQVAANPLCFSTAFLLAEGPLFTGVNSTQFNSAIAAAQQGLGCKPFTVNQTALAACPGFSLYGGPRGPVAPGAIQS